jgi:hypothetical protein
VHVIRHDNGHVKKVLEVVVVETTFQGDVSGRIRQYPSAKSAESHEVALVIALKMREFPPVEGHHNSRRDSRLGCPPEFRLPQFSA